jgi:hypothetical protein
VGKISIPSGIQLIVDGSFHLWVRTTLSRITFSQLIRPGVSCGGITVTGVLSGVLVSHMGSVIVIIVIQQIMGVQGVELWSRKITVWGW